MTVKLDVTKEAQAQVSQLIKSQKPGTAVRVYLQPGGGGGCGCGSGGGGCGSGCGSASSAPAFGMAFDRPRNGDQVIPVNGFSVVVDGASAEYLEGGTIDFVQTLEESGFKITSPLLAAKPAEGGGGCGCGSGGGGGCC